MTKQQQQVILEWLPPATLTLTTQNGSRPSFDKGCSWLAKVRGKLPDQVKRLLPKHLQDHVVCGWVGSKTSKSPWGKLVIWLHLRRGSNTQSPSM